MDAGRHILLLGLPTALPAILPLCQVALLEMRQDNTNLTAFCLLCKHYVEDMATHEKTEEHKRRLRRKTEEDQLTYSEVYHGEFYRCPHCGGRLFYRDPEDPRKEWHCINCARPVIFFEK
jgi:hypothetical protein